MPLTNNGQLARIARAALFLIASCAFAFGAKPAADQAEAELPSQKPKNLRKQQPVVPKQQQQQQAAPKKSAAPKKEKPAPSDEAERDDDDGPGVSPAPAKKAANKSAEKQHHSKFQAKPSATIATAQFNPEYRITAAQSWDGVPYEIFRSYQPQWHDQAWYQSRYGQHIQLIAGGWYFWEAGYWFPAWGYDESAAYYPYDGPIYVGQNPRPFDQVVADVQAILQQQGLYRGEIDGLVGPQTREALTAYQTANRLPPTGTLDQPTLDTLGLSE